MIEIVNRQRHSAIDLKRCQAFAEKAMKAVGKEEHNASIAFISDRQMRKLNRRFRGVDRPTDVLSFPASREEFEPSPELDLGDIAISVERAEAQAVESELEFDEEIAQLILHGLLHLCGHDHETDNGEMSRLEIRLRRQLGLSGK